MPKNTPAKKVTAKNIFIFMMFPYVCEGKEELRIGVFYSTTGKSQ
jgi:hypothetical protein